MFTQQGHQDRLLESIKLVTIRILKGEIRENNVDEFMDHKDRKTMLKQC